MSKHDTAMLERIRAAVLPYVLHAGLPEAVQDQAAVVAGTKDLLDAMKGLAELVIHTGEAVGAAKAADDAARAVLLDALEDTGAPALRVAHHTVLMVEGKPGFTVTEPELIPPALMRAREPEPDRNAIQKLLNAGQDVPGVALRNSRPHLRVVAKEA